MNHEDLDDDHAEVAALLRSAKPLPRASFRGSLRRHLMGRGAVESRPARLRLLVTAYATSGVGLLTVALIGVLGAGPLAAG